jgi:anti-sigma B factor antagonist
MEFQLEKKDLSSERSLVVLSGRLTAVNSGDVKREIRNLILEGKSQIVFDLSGISFIDSSGLAVFVSALKSAKEAGGWIKLAALAELPASIFRLTMLDRIIDMYHDVTAALEAAENE